jgi:phage gpG-like protein
MKDEWSPLFSELADRVSSSGRRDLLRKLIEQIEATAQLNLGKNGIDRPSEWASLKLKYALEFHDGDQTPTLILSGDMLRSFTTEIGNNSATLTNNAEYAGDHQEGKPGIMLPARPFFPVTKDGQLTPKTQVQLLRILDQHFEI